MLSVPITEAQVAALRRPLGSAQRGGFQMLIERIQRGIKQVNGQWTLQLTVEDAQRVVSYATGYGGGGYQGQLREILPGVSAALAGVPGAETGSLFGDG